MYQTACSLVQFVIDTSIEADIIASSGERRLPRTALFRDEVLSDSKIRVNDLSLYNANA